MQEEMEMKSGSAVRSGPVRSGNGGYEGVTVREKQQLEVKCQAFQLTFAKSNRSNRDI